jgi:hypothetical protein
MRYAVLSPGFRLRSSSLQCLRAVLWVLWFAIPASADTARLSGTIFTVDADHVQIPWPNARVTLKSLTSGREVATVSGELGQYSFAGILPGEYQLSVVLAGFAPFSQRITLGAGAPSIVDVQLVLQSRSEAITVTANSTEVDTSSSSGGAPVLNSTALKSLVRLNDDFQEALPLLPGVLRGPDGLIRVKGGNANQVNALINNVSIGDPFTGQPALRLPTAAVESMRVLSNPFSAEFGGFSSGVIDVTTRGGGDQWKWLFEDPIPRFRWIDGSIHGIESLTPHLAFSGPLIKGKLFIFQSLYLGYDTIRVPSLPNPNNVRIERRVNTQTQLDFDINPSHRLTVILTVDPQDTNHANIDTFNPPSVTNDYRQRGFFASVSDRWILSRGGFIESLFSLKRLDFQLFPEDARPGTMTLFPEENSGSFFATENRNTWLLQGAQALHLRPLNFGGRHLFTFGYALSRSTYGGTQGNLPVRVLREDGTRSSEITYGRLISSSTANDSVAWYFQDNWQPFSRLTLDLGLRLDHQSLSSDALDLAPRMGFVFAPSKDNRTAVRGGVGLFYDKIPLNVAVFPAFPAQTITQFAADGVTMVGVPTTYTHVIATSNGGLRLPYSVGATLQFDRKLRQNLLFRLGYEHRQGYREFFVDPAPGTPLEPAQLRLLNSGTQRYDEFLAMLRWNPTERTSLVSSYVRSRAFGELNDYNQFFGNNPYPLIRPNQYGPLPSDAPNRLLLWGVIGLPYRLQFVPILDTHTGFPYSKLDANWNYIGARDTAGRFPAFASLDLKLQYPFDFKFRDHRIQFLGGIKVIDVTNHYNPRDVQQYLGSPFYGVFYNSVGRLWRIDGDFDF